jgi:hypothetical protein
VLRKVFVLKVGVNWKMETYAPPKHEGEACSKFLELAARPKKSK